MSRTPLPKAAKPVWAKQLTRLPCLVVYAKFQFVYMLLTLRKEVVINGKRNGEEKLRGTGGKAHNKIDR